MSDDGEESPPRPRRKIKKVMVLSSASESDSDSSIAAAGTRRKRLRVVSEAESDSSGSVVVRAGARRRLPQIPDSERDSDSSGSGEDSAPAMTPAAAKPTSGFASDSSEGNSDKCSICLLRFKDQEVGTPQNCEHIFCLDCITEWSKNVNTCPVDRMTFDFIVVRTCAGGRVLRTEPVKVVERRSSVDLLVTEDPTACEICGSADNEETMLLCDGCDLGYHMQCLTPPITEVPTDQWVCPNCEMFDLVHLSEVDDLFTDMADVDINMYLTVPRATPLREPRNVRRSSRNNSAADEPSTSRGDGGNVNINELPSTSRGSRSSQINGSRGSSRRRTTAIHTTRRKYKRRRTKTVIIEYEVEENGKYPVTKRVKRKVKKRMAKKRRPRTAARRTHVLASVRARLREQHAPRSVLAAPTRGAALARAPLSLFGARDQLDYFSEDECDASEGASTATTAVAARPTSSVFSAYRQARRKMISVPSPPHASSAPDVLSSILESQTLLHSKNSVVSISVDGNIQIKLETRENRTPRESKQEKVDVSKGEDAARKVPSYPGQSRGGGWGGGYRGNYHREQGHTGFRGSYGNYGGGQQQRQAGAFQNNNGRREDSEPHDNYGRRPHSYDEPPPDRNRRHSEGRGPLLPPTQRPPELGRPLPAWQQYPNPPGQQYPIPPGQNIPPPHHRHSFGGFENPLDMRTGYIPQRPIAGKPSDTLVPAAPPRRDRAPPLRPLPEPPMFTFDKTTEVDKSEDERSDSSLVIDTEKYDPTEPTHDDDSGDEGAAAAPIAPALPSPPAPSTPPSPPPPATQALLAGLDTSGINVPHNILDSAVRQVLQEHRDLLAPSAAPPTRDRSDDDSDGDCPNFSIYSATSVHIANNTSVLTPAAPLAVPGDDLADLVQEDDDPSPPPPPPPPPSSSAVIINKLEEEYKEKVSKRCPITTNTRNPIKIKLNTPSLIRRHVSLYDDEEEEEDQEADEVEPAAEVDSVTKQLVEVQIDTDVKGMTANPQIDGADSKSPEKPLFLPIQSDDEKRGDLIDVPKEDELRTNEPGASPDRKQDDDSSQPTNVEVVDRKLDESDEETENRIDETTKDSKKSDDEVPSEEESSEADDRHSTKSRSSKKDSTERNDDTIEKMTESISETEDERSYTPCLDENKSKDTSLEAEKEKGIEGLDTEMISEDEGNEMFSEEERGRSEGSRVSPPPAVAPATGGEEGEIPDPQKDKPEGESKKKKKKESKKESKDKTKAKKKSDVAFRKLSKSGKERNYRERDKDGAGERARRDSSESPERDKRKRKRKEKRKDLERYDVRTVVTVKRRKRKDAFGRDVSPRSRSASRSPPPRRSLSPADRRSISPQLGRRSLSPRPSRRSPSPRITRRSPSTRLSRRSPSPRLPRRSPSPRLSRRSPSPRLPRRTPTPMRRSASPLRGRRSPSLPTGSARAVSPRSASARRRRRRSASRGKRTEPRRRRSTERSRKRRRSASASRSPRPKSTKRKKRARSERPASRRRSPRRKSPRRKRVRRRSATREPDPSPARAAPSVAPARDPTPEAWSPASVDSRLLSPRTPPPAPPPEELHVRRRRDPERPRHRRARDPGGPSKEVFTSGDNILVSVSFKDQEDAGVIGRRERRRERRRRRRRAAAAAAVSSGEPEVGVRPVAIIDLERSPFRELTPSPRNVIVLSDSEGGGAGPGESAPETTGTAPEPVGPKTPPEPAGGEVATEPAVVGTVEETRGPNTPPEPPDSPDAYDPYEPTRSASGSPSPAPLPTPPRTMTLEAAQKTNMSADEVLDRRPLSPIEKVMALLQSTRDVPPDPPPGDAGAASPPGGPTPAPALAPAGVAPLVGPAAAPAITAAPAVAPPPVRIVLPEPARAQAPKLFLAKPSPIKSDPIKPMQVRSKQMQATKISRLPMPSVAGVAGVRRRDDSELGDSPYSPGSSDFGELFEPPAPLGGGGGGGGEGGGRRASRAARSAAAKVPVKFDRKKGKTQVGVKIDEDNLKILDDLPSSAVEMQVKSKFLKKLNRQERVVEEVKLVLKPHYNKKHITKEEYKDVLRRAVPKICHNKTGEINPTKIQALIEAYVKKIRKKHKLGLV